MKNYQRPRIRRWNIMALLVGMFFLTAFITYPSVSSGEEVPKPMERMEVKDYFYDVNFNWLGIAYNLVYLDPDNYAVPAFKNPNLTIPPVVFALERGTQSGNTINSTTFMIPKGVSFYPGSANSIFDSTYQEIKSGNDYRNEMHASVSLSGGIKGLFSASGSASFKNMHARTRNSEERIYQVKGVVEGHWLKINLDSPQELKLSSNFKTAVQNLGTSLSYKDFINTWGTHFASTIVYGGKAYFRLAVEKDFISKYKLTEKDFNAAVEGTFKKVTASIKGSFGTSRESTETEERISQKIRAIAYGGDGSVIEQDIKAYNEWAESVRDNPTAIRLTLTEYHELFTRDFFPEDNEVQEKGRVLKAEIEQYLKKHHVDAKESGKFFEPDQLVKCQKSDSIESWWDGSAEQSIALDVSGKNNSILHGTAPQTLPDGDVVFNFDSGNGSKSYISVQHSDLFTHLTHPKAPGYTVALWILWNDKPFSRRNNGEALLIKGSNRENATFAVYLDRGSFGKKILRFTQKVKYRRKRWCRGIGGDKCAKDDSGYRVYTVEKDITKALIPGRWMHIAAMFDSKWHEETMSICVDGDCITKDPKRQGRYKCGGYKCQEWGILNVVDYPKNDLLIGMAPSGGDQFKGKMDDIQVFKGTLTNAEIMTIYQRGRDCR
jgi:hypothetical protein